MKFIIETDDTNFVKKLKNFLNENDIDFEVEDKEEDRARIIESFITVKEALEDNNIEEVKVIINHHYHPDYNCDEISFVAPEYDHYKNCSEKIEELNEKIYDIIYDLETDLYAELYSLDSDSVEEMLRDANINFTEIEESSDSDH